MRWNAGWREEGPATAAPHTTIAARRRVGYGVLILAVTHTCVAVLHAQPARAGAKVSSGGNVEVPSIPVCSSERGVPPRALADTAGRPVYVETTSSVEVGGILSLIGSPTFFWHDRTQVFDSLSTARMLDEGKNITYAGAGLSSGGAVAMALPSEDGRFITPRGVAYPAGTAFVIWGTTGDSSFRALNVDTLWQASFHGGRWTRPTPIYAGERIVWTPDAADIFSDGKEVRLSLSSGWREEGREREGAVMLRFDGRGWVTSRIPVIGMAPSEVVEVRGAAGLLQAFIGAGPVGGRVVQSGVILAEQGTSAREKGMRLLHDGEGSGLGSLHALAAGGVSYLLWIQSPEDASSASQMEGYLSRDRGVSWQPLPGQPLPARARAIRPYVQEDGSILVIAQADATRWMYSSVLREGSWSPVRRLPYTNVATLPALVDDGGQSPILVWGAVRGDTTGVLRSPQLHMIRVTERCGR